MQRIVWDYDFGTIRKGGSRTYPIETASSIRQAAHDYSKRHETILLVKVVNTQDGRKMRVYRVR